MTNPLTLADENTLEELILAIAYKAADDTRDMMNDMLLEKEYIASNGLPNRNDFHRNAIGFLVDVYPERDFSWMKNAEPGESLWTTAWRSATDEVMRRWPDLTKLTVDLSK